MKRFLMCVLMMLMMASQCIGMPGSVTWEAYWDANTEADLAGYYFYWKADSQEFSNDRRVDCGLNTTLTLTGIVPDDVILTVTAYDTSGNESPFCDEIVYDEDTTSPSCVNGFGTRKK